MRLCWQITHKIKAPALVAELSASGYTILSQRINCHSQTDSGWLSKRQLHQVIDFILRAGQSEHLVVHLHERKVVHSCSHVKESQRLISHNSVRTNRTLNRNACIAFLWLIHALQLVMRYCACEPLKGREWKEHICARRTFHINEVVVDIILAIKTNISKRYCCGCYCVWNGC